MFLHTTGMTHLRITRVTFFPMDINGGFFLCGNLFVCGFAALLVRDLWEVAITDGCLFYDG